MMHVPKPLRENRGCTVCKGRAKEQAPTSVSEEPIIMVCLEEAQHNCQDRQDQHDGETDVDEVRQGFVKGACHHSNPGLNVPVKAAKRHELTMSVRTLGRVR